MNQTAEYVAAFERDGYVIVPGLFEPKRIAAALQAAEQFTYGRSLAERLAQNETGIDDTLKEHGPGLNSFPIGIEALDSLLENEAYLDLNTALLSTNDMFFVDGHLFPRFGEDIGPDAKRYYVQPGKGYHMDNNSGTFLPPSRDVTSYAYVNSWVMLHDIDPDGAPLQVIPGSHRFMSDVLPRLTKTGDGVHGYFRDSREVPEFANPVSATGKAGDTLFYSSYTVHSAIPFANRKKQRMVWAMSLGRSDTACWTKFRNLHLNAEKARSVPFWTKTTPRVRSILGWPPPGHPYYTPQTLELLAAWFPGIDLEAYQSALTA